MLSFKNILFDFGGVLIDIDYQKTIRAFQELGFPRFEEMYSQLTADQIFSRLETGHISPEEFYDLLIPLSEKKITSDQIKEAWNTILVGYRKESLDFLIGLKQRYDLFLLSNTNSIHYEAFSAMLVADTGFNSLESFFKRAYFSHQIGLRKPHEEVYQYVIRDAGIRPEETLFIDDTVTNIEAASDLGFRVHLMKQDERIEEIFSNGDQPQ